MATVGQGWRWRLVAGALGATLWAVGCSGGTEGDGTEVPGATGQQTPSGTNTPDAGNPTTPSTDGGDGGGTLPDGGDGGEPDGGDGGDGGETDGGTPDDGGELTVVLPSAEGWTFYGPEQGGPQQVMGVSEDEGGNVWVAGGEEGLFLLRPGTQRFERFTMEDGLRPFGYMADGSEPPGGYKKLDVISVAGGHAGTVFVGYRGHPQCEGNGHPANPNTPTNPSIYKSGDADKVTLTANGIRVVHYDISSGPNVVPHYEYREKICHIYRIVYDRRSESVWFGANHGLAWGDATFQGNPTCNGQPNCRGIAEHVHPAIGGSDGSILTDYYYGIAPAPNGDVWFGGINRSARLRNPTGSAEMRAGAWNMYFDSAREEIEKPSNVFNRYDVWPDDVPETQYPTVDQRKDDSVSGMAAMADGTVWVSSFERGLAHLDSSGNVMGYAFGGQAMDRQLSGVVRDPADGSLWVGHAHWGGVSRMRGGTVERFYSALDDLAGHPVHDLQVAGSGSNRRVLVAFGRSEDGKSAGAIGIYTGQ